MKVLKGIFFFIMALVMVMCIGVLACAMSPSLTGLLAEKVEKLTSAQPGGDGGQDGLPPGGGDGDKGAAGTEVGQDGGSGDARPGINAGWMQDGDQAGYQPPKEQPVEAPVPVSGRSGYKPVQEDAEQVLQEEADNLAENAPLGNTGSELHFDAEIYPYYAMLEADMRSLYSQIYANALDMVQSFAPAADVNVEQLKTVFEAVYNDHPELFWLETGYSCKYLRNGSCVEITLKYNAASQELEKAKQEFGSRAEQILSQARTIDSDGGKERFVHDSLMKSVGYAINAPMNQSAYSALVQGQSVCAGYARAFQYLMQQLGIPCYYCTGYAGEDHAWNIVKLGGDYYNVDVTWDDTDTPTYDYFNKSDQEFGSTHVRTGLAVYLPACVPGGNAAGNPDGGSVPGAGGNGDGGASGAEGNGNSGGVTGTGGNGNGGVSGAGGNGNGGGASGAGGNENSGGNAGAGGSQDVGGGTKKEPGDDTAGPSTPTPMEPMTWHSKTGADLDTGLTEEEQRQEALEDAGITEDDIRDTLKAYYEDCGKLLRQAGSGDRQFVNVIPESLWDSVEHAYTSGDYWKGYVEDALKAMDVDSFVINLEVQDLGGGYCRLYHNVYTY